MKRFSLLILTCLNALLAFAQISAEWISEAEDKDTKVLFLKDNTIDIIAPKGVTLWNKKYMQGNITIEYDAQIVVEENNESQWNRLSDLNCFWMASDPKAKKGNVFINAKKRSGIFTNQYALQLYYLGYGGNNNTTTRFRKYNGDERGVTQTNYRPGILREYTDKNHLLKPNHWYHIRIEQQNGHIRYTIDGECIVDYLDIDPFTSGYFGFRTTLSHSRIRNFCYKETPIHSGRIALHWIESNINGKASPQTFGVPFLKGEMKASQVNEIAIETNKGEILVHDTWTLARWDDGTIKWQAFSTVVPAGTDSCTLLLNARSERKKTSKEPSMVLKDEKNIIVNAGSSKIYIPLYGNNIIDSITTNGKQIIGSTWLDVNGEYINVKNRVIEQYGRERTTIKYDGDGFSLRLYAHKESNEIKIVHTLIVDSTLNVHGIESVGLKSKVRLRDKDYKRFISFSKNENGGFHHMHVKPLIARRSIFLDNEGNAANAQSSKLIDDIASWDGFRLSQLSPNAFSIRKRATSLSPWIGTIEGHRSSGFLAIGDTQACASFSMHDFWQSYPSTLQVDDARSNEATVSLWLWSPEAEKMNFEHYDTIPHTLNAAYEDIQPGMSTAYGIARTSTLFINTSTDDFHGSDINIVSDSISILMPSQNHLLPTISYLHSRKAFGIWSLPNDTDEDKVIDQIIDFYNKEIDRNAWYGYFNYGDVMHTYDRKRGEWRYDVGGYAWDNTELGTNAMLWYAFLRTGNPTTWKMAEAMTRHTAEVDCYHIGPNAQLGSRHNVSHWGCGAKEARISQAFWNRFYYYLTADERTGDLMSEVKDADQMLYTLDPMRLAQPRSIYPCTAPARLRIGPDWLAYAGNWFTEWERTGNTKYLNKIISGMKSIASLPHRLFSGPKALGYDPVSGIITWEGDSALQNTNHLLSIMGGFEMMNEMLLSINCSEWNNAWLDHATHYKQKALEISKNKFLIPRLQAYSYWKTGNAVSYNNAWNDLLHNMPFSNRECIFTNDAATWTLDAIFMQEISKKTKNILPSTK